jgi:hypothetical protein
MKIYKFDAEIKKNPRYNSAYVKFPYSVEEEFGTKGQVRVQVTFDDFNYRGSLAKMGHSCHCVGLNKEVRKAIGKEAGDFVRVALQKDDAPRIVEVPADLDLLLNKNEKARILFDKLSFTHKKEYVQWIISAKKEETRRKRLEKTIAMLKNKTSLN